MGDFSRLFFPSGFQILHCSILKSWAKFVKTFDEFWIYANLRICFSNRAKLEVFSLINCFWNYYISFKSLCLLFWNKKYLGLLVINDALFGISTSTKILISSPACVFPANRRLYRSQATRILVARHDSSLKFRNVWLTLQFREFPAFNTMTVGSLMVVPKYMGT